MRGPVMQGAVRFLTIKCLVPRSLHYSFYSTRSHLPGMTDRNSTPADTHYRKWRMLAPLGLTTIGFGASLVGQSTILKAKGGSAWTWVAAGTVSLVVLNAGLSMFGDAVKHRALYEWKTEHAARA